MSASSGSLARALRVYFETRSGRPEKGASAANTVADLGSTVFDRVGKHSTADFGVAARSVTHL